MGFRLRSESASKSYTSATYISPQGETTAYPNGKLKMTELKRSDVAERSVPDCHLLLPGTSTAAAAAAAAAASSSTTTATTYNTFTTCTS